MVTNNSAQIPTGVSGTILRGGGVGSASAFSTATYPNTAGTSGNILTSDGTNIVSSSPAGAGASLVYLNSLTASTSASIIFNSTFITSTYNNYMVLISNLVNSSSSVLLTVSVDNGSNYIATGYTSAANRAAYTTATYTNANSTTSFTLGSTYSDSTLPGAVTLYLYNVTNGNNMGISGVGIGNTSNATLQNQIFGHVQTGSINNIKFTSNGTTITSGKFTLYGIRES